MSSYFFKNGVKPIFTSQLAFTEVCSGNLYWDSEIRLLINYLSGNIENALNSFTKYGN